MTEKYALMRESGNEEPMKKQFTLEEIEASWWATGKKIPIDEMMAWLIKAVNNLEHKINETAYKCRTPFECDFTAEEVLDRLTDWYLDGAERLDEQEKAIIDLKQALTDIKRGNIPGPTLDDIIEISKTDLAEARSRMYSWCQQRARRALKGDE